MNLNDNVLAEQTLKKLCLPNGFFDSDKISKNIKPLRLLQQEASKVCYDFESIAKKTGLKNGMRISFHHHFRGGDKTIGWVIDNLAKLGFKDLKISASSLPGGQKSLIEHIKNGVITGIDTAGIHGELGEAISNGIMEEPVVFRSHGGRASAISGGELLIDVAFLSVPCCDYFGNAGGFFDDEGKFSTCGSLGYAMVDVSNAKNTVLITNNIVEYPNVKFSISGIDVDCVLKTDHLIGDSEGIQSGTTRITQNPKDLYIAKLTAEVIAKSGYLYNGCSFQLGSGGISLAVGKYLKKIMSERSIQASFVLGGITASIVEMQEEGYVKNIFDVQSFDGLAAISANNNNLHKQISALYYAGTQNRGSAVDQLDVVVLSALEVDIDFNVNSLVGSDGILRGAIGGHSDTATGSALSIVTVPLIRGRIPSIVKEVITKTTPGKVVDIVVTDHGVAINPLRNDLLDIFKKTKININTIEQLQSKAEKLVGKPKPIKFDEKIVGVVSYRDNTVLDFVKKI